MTAAGNDASPRIPRKVFAWTDEYNVVHVDSHLYK
jgi:hypothetical protein